MVELNTLRFWWVCRDLKDPAHFISQNTKLKLKAVIDNDVGYSTLLARFFHNKIEFTINQIVISYLHFWDVSFGVRFFSLCGYLGIFFGFWYLVKSKLWIKKILIAILLLLPFVEVFSLISNFQVRVVVLALPYISLSIYGWYIFLNEYRKKGLIILAIFIILSLWYQYALLSDIFINCIKR